MNIEASKVDPFFNINRPEDLAEAEALLEASGGMIPPVFGITGWKNSGKTTLMARLIAEFTGRGYRVGAVKHAHESFDIDQPGRDSFKLREAGGPACVVVFAKALGPDARAGRRAGEPFDRLLGEAGRMRSRSDRGFKNVSVPEN